MPGVVTRRNLVPNPSFETGVDGWLTGFGSSLARTASFPLMEGRVGEYISVSSASGDSPWSSLLLNSSSRFAASEGDWVAVRVWVAHQFSSISRVRARMTAFADAAGAIQNFTTPLVRAGFYEGEWLTQVAQMPEGTVTARVEVQQNADEGNLSAGTNMWTDQWIAAVADTEAEALAAVEHYFDGDTPERVEDHVLYTYGWEGAPHASVSYESAPGPAGWGEGALYSETLDAVRIAPNTSPTLDTAPFDGTATLVLYHALTDETTYHPVTHPVTIPASAESRHVRAAVIPDPEYDGGYFDAHMPRTPIDQSIATFTWEGEEDNSPTLATVASVETESVQLWRAIDDGPWLMIADDVPPDTAISDPIPAIGERRVNHYRATSVSGIGSAMHSTTHELTVPTHGPGGNHGWVYVNGGPDFSDVVKVKHAATRSGSQGLAKVVRHYAGNPRPQERSGTAESRTWSIGVNARETLHEDGASRPEDIEALQVTGGVVCYRDPKGARWFASMGQTSDSYQAITGEVSWSMTEVDQPEGLASEARDQSHGDDDGNDDGGEVEPE